MANQSEIVERVVELIRTCVPAEDLNQAIMPGLICVAAGLLLVFYGTKAIRTLIVIACITGGGYLGWMAAGHFAKPPAIGIIGGAALLGLGGLLLARIFIAGLSGVMAAIVTLSVVGYHDNIGTRFETFAQTFHQPTPTVQNEFPLGEAGSSEALASTRPYQIVLAFAEHLDEQDTPTHRKLVLCLVGAGLVGIAAGFVAHRWAMIFWTSMAGLSMVIGGGGVLLNRPWPQWHEYVVQNASTVCWVTLGVWLLGMLVQWRGTRRVIRPAGRPAEAVSAST